MKIILGVLKISPLCLCVCAHECQHVCVRVYVYMWVNMYVCADVCMCIYMSIYKFECVYVCMYVSVYLCYFFLLPVSFNFSTVAILSLYWTLLCYFFFYLNYRVYAALIPLRTWNISVKIFFFPGVSLLKLAFFIVIYMSFFSCCLCIWFSIPLSHWRVAFIWSVESFAQVFSLLLQNYTIIHPVLLLCFKGSALIFP